MPLVLVVLVVVGALVVAMLAQQGASFRMARVSRNHTSKVYAANAALDWSVQRLRSDATACAGADGALTNAPTFNGYSVSVRCVVTAGAAPGNGGWSIYTTGTGTTLRVRCDSTTNACAGSAPKLVMGSVFNAGQVDLSGHVLVRDGTFVQDASACGPMPSRLTIEPNLLNGYSCRPRPPVPPPARTLQELATSLGDAAEPTVTGECKEFRPGRYSAGRPLLLQSGTNYLHSGVYVLDNVDLIAGDGQLVVGGRPSGTAIDELRLRTSSCPGAAFDAMNGVTIILAGSARVWFNRTQAELFPYRPGNIVDSRSTLSIYQLNESEQAGANPWQRNFGGAPAPTNAFEIGNYNVANAFDTTVVVHGGVHVARSGVRVVTSQQLSPALLSGVVASSFSTTLGMLPPSREDFSVGAGPAATFRTVQLDVTVARQQPAAEKPICARAHVVVSNDASRSYSVGSWRINEDTTSATRC
jgi:hypothetical protein